MDEALGADVRIAMTVAAAGEHEGLLRRVVKESEDEDGANLEFSDKEGKLQADLTIGANVSGAEPLRATENISSRGFELGGAGFITTLEEARSLGLGEIEGVDKIIRPYINGRDLTQISRNAMVIDLFGLTAEEVRDQFPTVYQWVYERVKPERDQNRSKTLQENWWLHRRLRQDLREMISDLSRYIVTVETAKHRVFVFLDNEVRPDNKLIVIALDDAYFLGVLSSRIHVAWALAAGSRLGVGNDPVYVKTNCFEKFPFPDATEAQIARIRELGERLDAHRKRQQAQHPALTLTDMYNVLEKLRAGDPLTAAERTIHEWGLVSVLRQLHDDLDAAVADAYGWPAALPDDEILARLVDLNAARAAEEKAGRIRWLRPDYQAPHEVQPTQSALLDEEAAPIVKAVAGSLAWPDAIPQQAQAVRAALTAFPDPASPADVAALFGRRNKARVDRVTELLEMLVLLGQAVIHAEGRYAAG